MSLRERSLKESVIFRAVRAAVSSGDRRRISKGRELVLVVLLFGALLAALFPRIVFGSRTFAPNGLLATQTPLSLNAINHKPHAAMGDAGAFVWIFEPLGQVVHRAYAQGALPLWNPYSGTGQPLAADFQSAVASPVYAPVFLKPTQRVWDFVFLLRLLIGGAGCFFLLRALGARVPPALVASVGYLLSPVFVVWIGSVEISVEMLAPWLLLAILGLAQRRTPARFAALALTWALAVLGGQPETLFMLGLLAVAWGVYVCLTEKARLQGWLTIAAAALVGSLLAVPQLWLGLEYSSLAFDAHGVGDSNRYDLLKKTTQYLTGDFTLRHQQRALGMVVLVLAVAGIAAPRVHRLRGSGFLCGVMIVWLAWVFHFPGYQLFASLPGGKVVKVFEKGAFFGSLAGAVLSVGGIEAILHRSRRSLLAATSAAVFFIPLTFLPSRLTYGEYGGLAIGLLVIAAIWFTAARSWLLPMIVFVLVVQFALLTPRMYAHRQSVFAPRQFVKFTQTASSTGERTIGLGKIMHPNYPAALGIEDPSCMDALYPKRYQRYLSVLLRASSTGNFAGQIGIEQVASPFLNALDVRFVAAPLLEELPWPQFKAVFTDVNAGVRVWKNTLAYPRAWIPQSISAVKTESDAERALLLGGGELETKSVIENPTLAMRRSVGHGAVTVEQVGWNFSRYRVQASAPATVVVSEEYYPGWEATVDGQQTPIRPANLMMRAITVPAGTHIVEFRYRPAGFIYGIWIAVAGALAVITCIVLALRSRLSALRRAPQ